MPVDLTNLDLDLTFLQEIADGSDEFMVETIGMFLQQTPVSLQDISTAIDAADWTAAGTAAHKMKSTLGFFGMLNSQALIQQIETSCKTGAPDAVEVSALFKQVETTLADNLVALAQIKEEKEAKL
jgi:HPt (histidine-containing phosphotransfer) domain-containing protein